MNFLFKFLRKFIVHTKNRFLFFGSLNFLITQIILGIMLLLFPVFVSTLSSQIFNVSLGYFIYSRYVFKVKNKFWKSNFSLFCLNALFIWLLNFSIIYNLNKFFNINKNIIAILLVPLLASYSYLFQKNIIFKKF